MKFVGHYIISAPRSAVWEALNDTEVLKACIPGCHRIEWVDDANLEATIKVNLGVAKPKFVGDLSLSNVDPARSYTFPGRGVAVCWGWPKDLQILNWQIMRMVQHCFLRHMAKYQVRSRRLAQS